jgi:hypothetical protein
MQDGLTLEVSSLMLFLAGNAIAGLTARVHRHFEFIENVLGLRVELPVRGNGAKGHDLEIFGIQLWRRGFPHGDGQAQRRNQTHQQATGDLLSLHVYWNRYERACLEVKAIFSFWGWKAAS